MPANNEMIHWRAAVNVTVGDCEGVCDGVGDGDGDCEPVASVRRRTWRTYGTPGWKVAQQE